MSWTLAKALPTAGLVGLLLWLAFQGTASSQAPGPGGGDEAKEPPPPAQRPAEAPPSPDVLAAIRQSLSGDARESARGAAQLRRMGPSIAPQLRYWVRKLRTDADRLRLVLEAVEGGKPSDLPVEKLTSDQLFLEKLLEAQAAGRAGEHRKALEIAEAILLLDPGNPSAWDLRRLVRRSRERIAAKELLEPSLEVDRLVCEVGQEPSVTFRLVNHRESEAVVEIHKGVLGEVDLSIALELLDGNSRLEQSRLRLQAPEDVERILIGPHKAWEHKVPFRVTQGIPLGGAVARVTIGGRFRPSNWRVDGSEEYGNLGLSIPELELWVVPPGEGEHAERPLEKLAAAVLFGKEQPFFVGGQLGVWAAEKDPHFNEKLIETLVGTLEELNEPRLKLACRFLSEVTGEAIEPTAAAWKAWWGKLRK